MENKNGKETRMDLMVMENLLYGRNLSRTYDLKGAIFARHVVGSSCSTFLDQNFIEDMRECPIYLSQRTKKLFERAIWNDTSFLTVYIMYHFGTDLLMSFINLIFGLNIQFNADQMYIMCDTLLVIRTNYLIYFSFFLPFFSQLMLWIIRCCLE